MVGFGFVVSEVEAAPSIGRVGMTRGIASFSTGLVLLGGGWDCSWPGPGVESIEGVSRLATDDCKV